MSQPGDKMIRPAKQVTRISPLIPISVLCMTSAQAYKVIHKHCLGSEHGVATLTKLCHVQSGRYFAHNEFDQGTCLLVETFKHTIQNPVSRILLMEFAGLVAVVTLVCLISANRSSAGLLVRWGPTFALMLMQVVTGAVALPIFFSLIVYHSSSSARASFVPSGYSRALLPAVICGYVLPSIALLAPKVFNTEKTWEWSLAFWQIFPVLVSVINNVLAFCFKNSRGAKSTSDAMMSTTFILSTMDMVILGSILMHCYAVYAAYSQGVTIKDFIPDVEMTSLSQVLHAVFAFDLLGFMIAIWTLIFYDTSRFAGTDRMPVAFLALIVMAGLGTIVLGPGGAAAWAWSNLEKSRLSAIVVDRPPKKLDSVDTTAA